MEIHLSNNSLRSQSEHSNNGIIQLILQIHINIFKENSNSQALIKAK